MIALVAALLATVRVGAVAVLRAVVALLRMARRADRRGRGALAVVALGVVAFAVVAVVGLVVGVVAPGIVVVVTHWPLSSLPSASVSASLCDLPPDTTAETAGSVVTALYTMVNSHDRNRSPSPRNVWMLRKARRKTSFREPVRITHAAAAEEAGDRRAERTPSIGCGRTALQGRHETLHCPLHRICRCRRSTAWPHGRSERTFTNMPKTMHETERLPFGGAVDADGHILEPPDLWETYLEPKYRDRALAHRARRERARGARDRRRPVEDEPARGSRRRSARWAIPTSARCSSIPSGRI